MTAVAVKRPWLEFDPGGEMQVLSWATNRSGFVTARRIFWRDVCNADLSEGSDVERWLSEELESRQTTDAPTLFTSRGISRNEQAAASLGGTTAHCLAAVWLTNADGVGYRSAQAHSGTATVCIAVAAQASSRTFAARIPISAKPLEQRFTAQPWQAPVTGWTNSHRTGQNV